MSLTGSRSQFAVQQSINEEINSSPSHNLRAWWPQFFQYSVLYTWCIPPFYKLTFLKAFTGLWCMVSFLLGTRIPSHQLPFSSPTASTPIHIAACYPSDCFGKQTYSTQATILLHWFDMKCQKHDQVHWIELTHRSVKFPRLPMLLGMGPLNRLLDRALHPNVHTRVGFGVKFNVEFNNVWIAFCYVFLS